MRLVLDTNVVLDWLLFELPVLEPLREALREGRVTVLTHALVSGELARVLDLPQLERYVTDSRTVLDDYRTQTAVADVEPALLTGEAAFPKAFPRCRDPDDDKFLALAFHAKADALVSKDKAVLELRKRMKPFGFGILTVPELLSALKGEQALAVSPVDPSPARAAGIP